MGNSKEFNQQESEDSVGTDPNGTIHNEDLDSDEVRQLTLLWDAMQFSKAAIQFVHG